MHHFDLYRLEGASERPEQLERLELDKSFTDAVSVIEWPDRLGEAQTPSNRLDIYIEFLKLQGTSDEQDTNSTDKYGEKRPVEDLPLDADEVTETRLVTFAPSGESWKQRIQDMVEEMYG